MTWKNGKAAFRQDMGVKQGRVHPVELADSWAKVVSDFGGFAQGNNTRRRHKTVVRSKQKMGYDNANRTAQHH